MYFTSIFSEFDNFHKRGLGWKLNPQTKGSQSYLSLATLHLLFPILQTSFMPYLVIVTHHASFGHPMTKILAKFRLFGVFSTLLGVKIILLDFFLFETLFLYQIPLIWCTTWVYSAGLNIFIKRGLGCKLAPQKKGSQSYLSMLFLHFLFSIPQRSFMPNLVLVK